MYFPKQFCALRNMQDSQKYIFPKSKWAKGLLLSEVATLNQRESKSLEGME